MNGIQRLLLAVVASALAAGTLAGCLTGRAETPPSEFTVPFPRLGDHAVYDFVYTDHETGEQRSIPAARTLDVLPTTGEARDAFGRVHEVYTISVQSRRWDVDDPNMLVEVDSIVEVDVETNLVVRQGGLAAQGWSSSHRSDLIDTDAQTAIWANETAYDRHRPFTAGGYYQGETIAYEEGYVYEPDPNETEPAAGPQPWELSPFDVQFGLIAGRSALVNGHVSYGVERHFVEAGYEGARIRWLSPDVPYLVLEESEGQYDDEGVVRTFAYQEVLAVYEAGTSSPMRPLPGKEWPARNEAIDWGPANGFPPEGAPLFGYSLADAEASVRDDEGLEAFQRFLAGNPQARLETAWFRVSDGDVVSDVKPPPPDLSLLTGPASGQVFTHSLNWMMIFTSAPAPQGDRYVVASRQYVGEHATHVRNLDVGAATYECRFHEACVEMPAPPSESPTLGQLGRLAEQQLVAISELNFLYWGLDIWSYDIEYVSGESVQAFWDELWPLERLQGWTGTTPYGSVFGASESSSTAENALPAAPRRIESYGEFVYIDPMTGGLQRVVRQEESGHERRSVLPEDEEPRAADIGPSAPFRTNAAMAHAVRFEDVAAAAASIGLTAFLLVYFWPALKVAGTSAVMPLYAKIRKERVLDQKTRETLMELVRAEPGINPQEIRRRTGLGWGTVVHHLRTLQKNRLVMSAREGRYRRFFAVGSVHSSQKPAMALMKNAFSSRILDLIREHPGISHGELAREAKLDPGTVTWHIKRMRGADMLRIERASRRQLYFVKDAFNN